MRRRHATWIASLIALAAWGGVLAGHRFPGESWRRYATPEQAGFSGQHLEEASRFMRDAGLAAALVVRDGAVVAAWGEIDRRLPVHEISGALISALYGIHAEHGHIDPAATLEALGVDDIGPELTDEQRQVRVIDLLEGGSSIRHSAVDETPGMMLRRGASRDDPGSQAVAGAWDRNALVTIFEQVTGADLLDELHARIAAPLSMQDFRPRDGSYIYVAPVSVHPAVPLHLSARDLARFGHLVLREGRWHGRQVIPRSWVAESVRHRRTTADGAGYGLQWTIATHPRYARYGMISATTLGHTIDVLPALDLVVVQRSNSFHGPIATEAAQLRLLDRILHARRGEPVARPELIALAEERPRLQTVPLSDEARERVVGTYRYPFGVDVRVSAGSDGLVIELEKGVHDLLPLSETEFLIADREERVYLRSRGAGKTPELIVEDLLRRTAYYHVWLERPDLALELMRRGAEYYPHSYRVHDGLGEIYALVGDVQLAVASYKRSLILNPRNRNAARMLRLLQDNVIALKDLGS
jgi:CubicO group peptidase (beta-lactamase class C family)